ncbi:hypothetical protein [Sporohalobacter salinus]|uniref:hypothetical protein n=1 Tax=Sporohalobacter salinus TaxID=1494606 RepID=UPI00195F9E58|nr:hypothetical protein [Sporohalobacter salinus]MBM7623767.1 DNA-directed RNA polymerase subunit RPC12/RpoP [Sporohalobacter salinus]
MSNKKDAKNNRWKPCPRCKSKKVKVFDTKHYVNIAFIGLAVSGVFLFIPILGWILFPFALVSVLIMFIQAFYKDDTFRCEECNYQWTIKNDSTEKKEELNESENNNNAFNKFESKEEYFNYKNNLMKGENNNEN